MTLPDKKCPRCGLWNSASTLVCDCGYDFKSGRTAPPVAVAAAPLDETRRKLRRRFASGARSFFWLAGFNLWFTLGVRSTVQAIVGVTISAVFVCVGLLAGRRHLRVYLVGMILYSIDLLAALVMQNYIAVAVHIVILIWMWDGYRALRSLAARER